MKEKLEQELQRVRDDMQTADGSHLAYLEGWEMALTWMIRQEEKSVNV